MALVIEALASGERDFCEYITVEAKAMSATYVRDPGTVGSAVPGEDGTEPRRRILRFVSVDLEDDRKGPGEIRGLFRSWPLNRHKGLLDFKSGPGPSGE
jgi:hypothetical protein